MNIPVLFDFFIGRDFDFVSKLYYNNDLPILHALLHINVENKDLVYFLDRFAHKAASALAERDTRKWNAIHYAAWHSSLENLKHIILVLGNSALALAEEEAVLSAKNGCAYVNNAYQIAERNGLLQDHVVFSPREIRGWLKNTELASDFNRKMSEARRSFLLSQLERIGIYPQFTRSRNLSLLTLEHFSLIVNPETNATLLHFLLSDANVCSSLVSVANFSDCFLEALLLKNKQDRTPFGLWLKTQPEDLSDTSEKFLSFIDKASGNRMNFKANIFLAKTFNEVPKISISWLSKRLDISVFGYIIRNEERFFSARELHRLFRELSSHERVQNFLEEINEKRNTLLHYITENKYGDWTNETLILLFGFLTRNKVSALLMTPGQNGLTPIHHIANNVSRNWDDDTLRLVVDYLEVDHLSTVLRIAEQDRKDTVLHIIVRNECTKWSCDSLVVMLSGLHGTTELPLLLAQETCNRWTMLHIASFYADLSTIKFILLSLGARAEQEAIKKVNDNGLQQLDAYELARLNTKDREAALFAAENLPNWLAPDSEERTWYDRKIITIRDEFLRNELLPIKEEMGLSNDNQKINNLERVSTLNLRHFSVVINLDDGNTILHLLFSRDVKKVFEYFFLNENSKPKLSLYVLTLENRNRKTPLNLLLEVELDENMKNAMISFFIQELFSTQDEESLKKYTKILFEHFYASQNNVQLLFDFLLVARQQPDKYKDMLRLLCDGALKSQHLECDFVISLLEYVQTQLEEELWFKCIGQQDENGSTLLHHAALLQKEKVVMSLLDLLDDNTKLNIVAQQDDQGQNLLHICAKSGFENVFLEILNFLPEDYFIDYFNKDKSGLNPMDCFNIELSRANGCAILNLISSPAERHTAQRERLSEIIKYVEGDFNSLGHFCRHQSAEVIVHFLCLLFCRDKPSYQNIRAKLEDHIGIGDKNKLGVVRSTVDNVNNIRRYIESNYLQNPKPSQLLSGYTRTSTFSSRKSESDDRKVNPELGSSGSFSSDLSALQSSSGSQRTGELIGSGSFADVYKHIYEGRIVAAKRFRHQGTQLDEKERRSIIKEISIMQMLQHHCLVDLVGTNFLDGGITIYLNYCSGGNLQDFIKSRREAKDLPWALRFQIGLDIICGLSYLHGQNVVHGDLKSPNVLLAGDDNRAKIADFGLSKVYNPLATGTAQARGTNRGAGTMLWMSPEVYQGFERTCSDDIWSFAMVISELCTLMLPFTPKSGDTSFVSNCLSSCDVGIILSCCEQLVRTLGEEARYGNFFLELMRSCLVPRVYVLCFMPRTLQKNLHPYRLYLNLDEEGNIIYRTHLTSGSDSVILEDNAIPEREMLHAYINENKSLASLSTGCKHGLFRTIKEKGHAESEDPRPKASDLEERFKVLQALTAVSTTVTS